MSFRPVDNHQRINKDCDILFFSKYNRLKSDYVKNPEINIKAKTDTLREKFELN